MKKSQIAVAVAAALPVIAVAQVTVSGTLDTGYYSVKNDNKAGTDVVTKYSGAGLESRNSTSEFVISGTEDLGGGLRAFFRFSNAIGSATDNTTEATDTASSGTLAARDVFVGLSGGFGSLQIGRFTPATETLGNGFTFGTVNFVGHAIDTSAGYTTNGLAARSLFTPGRAANDFTTTAISTAEFGRKDDNVQYTSPNFGGVVATIGVSQAKMAAGTTMNQVKQSDLALRYSAGPLSIGAAQARQDFQSGASTTAVDADVTVFGISYDLGVAQVRVVQGSNKVKLNAAQIQKQKQTGFGVSVPLSGALSVYASMSDGDNKGSNSDATTVDDLSATQVGGQYNLSKRTNVYAIYGENKGKQKSTGDTEKVTGFTVGLRHSF